MLASRRPVPGRGDVGGGIGGGATGGLYGREWTRSELLERVGDVSQVGGARPIRYAEGPEDGVPAVQVRTGGGLSFTVLPGRGLDLGEAHFNGAPLCWRS